MDILTLAVYIISITGITAVATVIAMGGYDRSRLFFALSMYTSCIWMLIQYLAQVFSVGGDLGLMLIQFSSSIAFVISVLFYCFIKSYVNRPLSKLSYLLFVIVFIIETILNMSGVMISRAWGESAGIIVGESSILYQIYILIVGVIFICFIFILVRYTLTQKARKDKARSKLIIFGFLQAVVVIVLSNTFFQSSAESQIAFPIVLLIASILIGLAIIKYQLFDIKFAAVRTVAYALSLITLSLIYYGLAYLVSITIFHGQLSSTVSISPINIALALALAFIFQPIKKFFDEITNKIFYSDRYNSDEFFARLNRTLSSTTDLRGLLARAAHEIGDTLKSQQTFFFVHTFNGHFMTAGTAGHKQLPKSDALALEALKSLNHDVVVASLLENDDPIKRLMMSHQIEIVMPLVQTDDYIGFLCLGYHQTSGYTNRDMRALRTISDSLNIAVQNALSIEEVKDLNSTLQQRVNEATRELRASNAQLQRLDKIKDEFVGIASHQLRTPLTSVKGYISMVLEGDAGEITDSQRQLLDEAFNSSERMVHLIGDFLNVSRLQTGKFMIDKQPVDLAKVVTQEIDSLIPNATARSLQVKCTVPKDFPIIDMDEGKIRQVVMNFADNALYYSHENTTINVDLSIEGHEAIYTVKDTGIGVPESEREQLFTKFYRASNAKKQRPDGTGVGLFLAKKIIDAHGGKIIFESVEGQGSTFGFRLPIK